MKTKLTLILILFLIFSKVNAQSLIFDYDAAGNQEKRSYCSNCKLISNDVKDYKELTDADMNKFFPDDVISYYPNPVKDELFLKWELINNNKVEKISILSLTGQIIQSFNILGKENTKNISFRDLQQGTYLVALYYTDGDQKSITIIKK
jgi:hypothetical protein